jgi:DNA-binding response OmpR family regulator
MTPRVLLVEDDQFLRRACEASLRQQGFVVVSARDGEEGLRLACSESFDAIVLDLLMPKVTGIDVLVGLKARDATRHVPVVILSNSARDEDKDRARQLGAVRYYVKANLSLKALGEDLWELVGTEHSHGRK